MVNADLDDFEREELNDWDSKSPEEQRRLLKKMKKHRELVKENVEVGIMFASKAIVQVPKFCKKVLHFVYSVKQRLLF